jgi:hypothetical protein
LQVLNREVRKLWGGDDASVGVDDGLLGLVQLAGGRGHG